MHVFPSTTVTIAPIRTLVTGARLTSSVTPGAAFTAAPGAPLAIIPSHHPSQRKTLLALPMQLVPSAPSLHTSVTGANMTMPVMRLEAPMVVLRESIATPMIAVVVKNLSPFIAGSSWMSQESQSSRSWWSALCWSLACRAATFVSSMSREPTMIWRRFPWRLPDLRR